MPGPAAAWLPCTILRKPGTESIRRPATSGRSASVSSRRLPEAGLQAWTRAGKASCCRTSSPRRCARWWRGVSSSGRKIVRRYLSSTPGSAGNLPDPNTEKELSAPLTRSAAVAAEQLQELLLVQHRHTELLGPCELRTRLAPGDDVAGLLRHARGHLGAARGERLLGLLAGHAGERAGDDEGAPGERAGAAGRGLQIRPRHTFIA